MKETYRILFLSLACVIIFNISITSATVFLHEISHYLAGVYFGCEEIRVVLIEYPELKAYTEARCKPNTQYMFLASSPFILISLFSASFLLLNNLPEKQLGWTMSGFNFIIGISDSMNFLPSFMVYLTLIFGVILIISGQFLFINEILLLIMTKKGGMDDLRTDFNDI